MKTLAIFAAAAALAASARGEVITAEPDALLDYIEATGSQYIDTGVNAETGLKAIIDFAWADEDLSNRDWSLLDACTVSSDSNKRSRIFMCHMLNGKPFFGYGKTRGNPAGAVPFVGGQRCEIITDMSSTNSLELTQNGVDTFDETDRETFATNGDVNLNLNLFVFATNYGGSPSWYGKGKLYELKIFRKNATTGEFDLLRHYLPCIKDNRAGLYDKVKGTISFSSADFIAGSVTNTVTPTPWKALQEQLNEGGTVTLTNDVTATSIDMTLTVTKAVTLDLNGHTIDANGKFRVIEIRSGGHLTLTNSVEGTGTITGGSASEGGGVYVEDGGAFTMTGGTISGNLALSGTATVTLTGDIVGTVTIAAGQVFTDGNDHYYSGTLSTDEKNAINGQTLTRLTTLQLADDADNSAAIAKCNGITFPVTLQGRTLYKDGDWNTICLPFDVTLAGSPLAGAEARPLSSANISGTTLNLTFGDAVTTLVAGTPYIIKWASGDNISNPIFNDVTISSTTPTPIASNDGTVTFIGNYSPVAFDQGTAYKDVLFLGSSNNLYYPNGEYATTIGACRAYFQLTDPSATVKEFRLNFGNDTETGIINYPLSIVNSSEADAWYDLNGRRLSGKPTKKGIYLNGGRKVVVP